METITFQNRSFSVTQECPVPAMLAADGLVRQFIAEGKKGATFLMQIWQNGTSKTLRAISATGCVQSEAL